MPRKIAIWISCLVLLIFAVFVVNQTAQVVQLANAFDPRAGRVVLYALLAVYGLAITVPLALFIRLPKALTIPADEKSPEYRQFLSQLHARLRRNPLLAAIQLENGMAGIEAAFRELDKRADEVIKKSASTLFVTTAISQNGRLDALLVLASQTRMIWNVARIYNQRPSIREWADLYANVAAAIFVANELEDLDIAEQIEPVITAAVGSSVMGMIPGISVVASIATQAVLDGTANAYLTLRVGLICQLYCKSLTAFDQKRARRFASVTAAGMLAAIVSASAGKVLKSIGNATKKAGAATVAKLNPFSA